MALRRLEVTQDTPLHPAYVVWELTLACDQPCTHCGSRAGDARADGALHRGGAEGRRAARGGRRPRGRAHRRRGLPAPGLPRHRRARSPRAGIRPTMTTGGRGVTPALAARMAAAGLHAASVSIDGLEPTHDLMRACRGSFASATAALAPPSRGGRADGGEHQPQPAQRRRPRGPLRPPRRARDLVVAGADHRAARAARPTAPTCCLQPWDLLDVVPRVDRAQAQGARAPASC